MRLIAMHAPAMCWMIGHSQPSLQITAVGSAVESQWNQDQQIQQNILGQQQQADQQIQDQLAQDQQKQQQLLNKNLSPAIQAQQDKDSQIQNSLNQDQQIQDQLAQDQQVQQQLLNKNQSPAVQSSQSSSSQGSSSQAQPVSSTSGRRLREVRGIPPPCTILTVQAHTSANGHSANAEVI